MPKSSVGSNNSGQEDLVHQMKKLTITSKNKKQKKSPGSANSEGNPNPGRRYPNADKALKSMTIPEMKKLLNNHGAADTVKSIEKTRMPKGVSKREKYAEALMKLGR